MKTVPTSATRPAETNAITTTVTMWDRFVIDTRKRSDRPMKSEVSDPKSTPITPPRSPPRQRHDES